MEELTPEESALLIQSLIRTGLVQPKWEPIINSILKKMGLEEAAADTFDHYKRRAERRQAEEKREKIMDCNCEMTVDPNDRDDDWHYDRVCLACGEKWRGLHCPHDGYQNPCPYCGSVPEVVNG